MITDQIKKLATALYGHENLETTCYVLEVDNLPYRAGMWLAFVSRTAEDCPNELLRVIDTGWGLSEVAAITNLRDRFLRDLESRIERYSEQMMRVEKANSTLEKLLKLQKEVRETL